MKILSYTVKNNMIKIITDNPNRPDFVYDIDKFKNIEQLEVEINKSIEAERNRNLKNSNSLISELNEKVK